MPKWIEFNKFHWRHLLDVAVFVPTSLLDTAVALLSLGFITTYIADKTTWWVHSVTAVRKKGIEEYVQCISDAAPRKKLTPNYWYNKDGHRVWIQFNGGLGTPVSEYVDKHLTLIRDYETGKYTGVEIHRNIFNEK